MGLSSLVARPCIMRALWPTQLFGLMDGQGAMTPLPRGLRKPWSRRSIAPQRTIKDIFEEAGARYKVTGADRVQKLEELGG